MLDACKNTIKPLLRNANLKAKPDKGTMVVDCGIVLLFIKYLLLPKNCMSEQNLFASL